MLLAAGTAEDLVGNDGDKWSLIPQGSPQATAEGWEAFPAHKLLCLEAAASTATHQHPTKLRWTAARPCCPRGQSSGGNGDTPWLGQAGEGSLGQPDTGTGLVPRDSEGEESQALIRGGGTLQQRKATKGG